MTETKGNKRSIVSSSHLVSEKAAALSEFEYGLVVAENAFGRWIVRCMAAAGYPDLAALDIQVLHQVNHRDRAKKLADLCFLLNVEDTHTVNYALKKLLRLGMIEGQRQGKEMHYSPTKEGQLACAKYREVREDCLIEAFGSMAGGDLEGLNKQVSEAAQLLRALSGLYDQAARAASSL
ncbi:winged helix DNA-binding protein [Rhodovibrionaceae bacterium A322]